MGNRINQLDGLGRFGQAIVDFKHEVDDLNSSRAGSHGLLSIIKHRKRMFLEQRSQLFA